MLARTHCQRLAIAVLERALLDAWARDDRVKHDARTFIQEPSELRMFWCGLAEVSEGYLVRALLQPRASHRPYPGSRATVAVTDEEQDA